MANSTSRIQLANYLNGSGFNNRNYIVNPSAHRNQTENIVLGAGVSSGDVTRNTSSPLTAISDFQISFNSATNEYVEWTLDTIDRADQGGNCEFSGSYKLSLGSGATVQAQVYQGGNLAASVNLPAESASRRFTLNVPCGTSTTTVRFAQTVSTSTSTLNVAALYYGRASNVGSVAQASMYGGLKWAGTTNCQWQTTATTFGNFSADADCTTPTGSNLYGAASAPSTKVPGITFSSLPPGEYMVIATGGFQANGGAAPSCSYRFHDGTTGSAPQRIYANGGVIEAPAIQGRFVYTTAQSNVTIQLQAAGDSVATCYVMSDDAADSASRELEYRVYRFPSSSEIAVRPENAADLLGTVFYTGSASCPTGSLAADGTAVSRSLYATLFARISTTFGVGDGSTTFNVPNLNGIFIRGTGNQSINGRTKTGPSLGATQEDQFQGHYHDAPAGTDFLTSNSTFSFGGGGAVVQLGNLTAATAQPITDGTNGTPRTGAETYPSNLGMKACIWTVSQNAPLLVGSVTSNSTGAERIERVRFGGATESPVTQCTSNPCTIYSQSGSWLTSVSYTGTGRYTLNIAAGIFSSPPTCTGNPIADTASVDIRATSSTEVLIRTNDGGTAAAKNEAVNMICFGPR